MKPSLSVLPLVAMLALAASAGKAQTLSHMIRDTGLSPQDFTMMDAAAAGLYTAARPRVGGEAAWSNPESMSHGTVRLEAMQGGCAVILHAFHAKGAAKARDLRIRRCRDADGRWLLQP
ncbi:MAG: hypothetical protein ACK5MY_01935 [Jhaorihella sp.]